MIKSICRAPRPSSRHNQTWNLAEEGVEEVLVLL